MLLEKGQQGGGCTCCGVGAGMVGTAVGVEKEVLAIFDPLVSWSLSTGCLDWQQPLDWRLDIGSATYC